MEPHSSATPSAGETATLAGGCFWCLEAVFDGLRGVDAVTSGYMGGAVEQPTYEQVCSGATGHAEVVQIVFDPHLISFRDILQVFFAIHDPTTLNRQGNDAGTQYRSAVFYHSDVQQQTAQQFIRELAQAGIWPDPIVTEVVPARIFYPAEDYHQDYFKNNPHQPYCQIVVAPKVRKLHEKFPQQVKKS
jgi:peptide-methionine (S)-S-oxide reductase